MIEAPPLPVPSAPVTHRLWYRLGRSKTWRPAGSFASAADADRALEEVLLPRLKAAGHRAVGTWIESIPQTAPAGAGVKL